MLQNLYPHLAGFHGLFRWIALAVAVSATYVAFSGWRAAGPPSRNFVRLAIIFVFAMDLELVTGLLLYFSASSDLRGTLIAHSCLMLLAVVCAHVGGACSRKARSDVMKYRGAAISYSLSPLLMLAGIPWRSFI